MVWFVNYANGLLNLKIIWSFAANTDNFVYRTASIIDGSIGKDLGDRVGTFSWRVSFFILYAIHVMGWAIGLNHPCCRCARGVFYFVQFHSDKFAWDDPNQSAFVCKIWCHGQMPIVLENIVSLWSMSFSIFRHSLVCITPGTFFHFSSHCLTL